MAGDGLYDPLGRAGTAERPGSRLKPVLIATACVVTVGAALAYGMWPRPATQIVGTAPITAAPATPAVLPAPIAPATAPAQGATVTALDAERDSGVRVVRPNGAPPAQGTFIPVPQPDTLALVPAPDIRVAELTRIGVLPRRGADGARPATVYARPVAPGAADGKPRVALFVGGMGLNAGLTLAAAHTLPPAVTLGFAPYGGDLPDQVAKVRALGHETVLQIPMESYNAGDDTGAMPRLLTVEASPQTTLEDLHWQMTRFAGYAGVSSFLGAKFTADAASLKPVLKDIGDRGLFYLDDGTAPRNLAAALAPSLDVPVVKADVAINALSDPSAIEADLARLEGIARAKGSAVGATTGLPTAVDLLAAFASRLEAHGLVLVPVSAMAGSATAAHP